MEYQLWKELLEFTEGDEMILPHTCANEFQDKRYGKGMRVMNPTGKALTKSTAACCTVCGGKVDLTGGGKTVRSAKAEKAVSKAA
jgi:hypothetical protein